MSLGGDVRSSVLSTLNRQVLGHVKEPMHYLKRVRELSHVLWFILRFSLGWLD